MSTTLGMDKESKKLSGEEKFLSPEEVRKALDLDNQEIYRLCKEANIAPKRERTTGKMYFLKNDVEMLKQVKKAYEKSEKIMNESKNPVTSLISKQITNPIVNKEPKFPEVNTLINSVIEAKENIIQNMSSLLDEKLGGIDEVIVELIKCKVENEKLKTKIEQLTSDNEKISKDLENFKPIALGLYLKKD